MNAPTVVSPEEWQAAREELLVKEKQLLRARDALAAERRRMPWQAVEKEYRFEGPTGELSFADLFDVKRGTRTGALPSGRPGTTHTRGPRFSPTSASACTSSHGRRAGTEPERATAPQSIWGW